MDISIPTRRTSILSDKQPSFFINTILKGLCNENIHIVVDDDTTVKLLFSTEKVR